MKNILSKIFLCILLYTAVQAQQRVATLSATAKQYLYSQQIKKAPHQLATRYVYYKDSQNQVYVNTIFKVNNQINEGQLKQQNVITGIKSNDIWTAKVPISHFQQFIKNTGIEYIDMDQPAYPELDTARRLTRVDSVHQGIYLPQAYSGKNVVVGIVDAGFDYTHTTFFDTSLTHYRIKRAWEQKNSNGPAPANFGYGTEYSDSAAIWNKYYDIINATHGTHVMGIAGGSGGGSSIDNKRYRGMAFESDLVTVAIYPTPDYWLNTGMVDMLDGIKYVFDYATSVNKPAVANLSWGCPLGPRDGTSLFSQACNSIVGSGKIFVLSGGNNGNNNIHLKKSFTTTDTIVNTICTFSTYLSEQRNQLDVWGEAGKSFCMSFSLYNANTKTDSSYTVCLDDSTHNIFLIGSNADTCFITLTTVSSEFNGKPHMLIQLYSRTNDRLAISIKAAEGTVNMWQGIVVNTSGYYGTFTKYSYSWAVNGDSQMTCGDLVSTSEALAVAAYNSKPSFTNISGQSLTYNGYPKGAISAFSSKGPTADGRIKPDIAGPGLALASSISSLDSTYYIGGDDYSSVITSATSPFNGISYSYAVAAGTSMSSPSVSGIVALLLQADSSLTPAQVKSLLFTTAIQDSKTGVIPPGGSNTWGFGKVNAYRAMAKLLGVLSVKNQSSKLACSVFPNPGNGNYHLELYTPSDDNLTITISTLNGQVIKQWNEDCYFGVNMIPFNLNTSAKGIYFLTIQGKDTFKSIKLIRE